MAFLFSLDHGTTITAQPCAITCSLTHMCSTNVHLTAGIEGLLVSSLSPAHKMWITAHACPMNRMAVSWVFNKCTLVCKHWGTRIERRDISEKDSELTLRPYPCNLLFNVHPTYCKCRSCDAYDENILQPCPRFSVVLAVILLVVKSGTVYCSMYWPVRV